MSVSVFAQTRQGPSPRWLSEADLRRWRACPRQQWLHLRHGEAANARLPAPAEPDVVYGPEPGQALRASFPDALAIAEPQAESEWAEAVRRTTQALADPARQTPGAAILGACLCSDDGARVRVDVLQRGEHGWRLFKLRLATVADEADVDALALWAHVVARAGWRLQSVGLLLVDTGFVYPGLGCYAGIFREVDAGGMLGTRPVADWLPALHRGAQGPLPLAPLGAPCAAAGGCRFMAQCHADEPPARQVAPELSLDIVGKDLACELRREGHVDLRSVPPQRLADARHRRALRAVQQGAPVLEPGVARLLREQPWPRHYLRFETIGFAVPVWPGTRPYQVLPFQWSCDVEAAPGAWRHESFLADARGDPRRAFATRLLSTLGGTGCVFAYNAGFERNRIRELAQQFDDLREPLEALLPRIVDLFQVARTHYYHPGQAGSWSARVVFGLIAPELQVGRLARREPGAPLLAFAQSLQRGLAEAERQRLRADLQDHGRRRTEALRRMVALFEAAT